ncbi:MAG: hypothetical protein M3N98_10470, partial [Actinomycetota bacterium]|nr:hypothetical protein [Actinomycetota bacterium]
VVKHPVHGWAGGPDRATLAVYKGFCQWGSTMLAASLPTWPARHRLSGGSPAPMADFLAAIGHGLDPVAAVDAAGAPVGVAPLVQVVCRLVSSGSDVARLGASALGLPCCGAHQAWALNCLAMRTTGDPSVNVEAVAAARQVLEVQVGLYDAAAEVIRRRHMTMHPSVWRPTSAELQPAG